MNPEPGPGGWPGSGHVRLPVSVPPSFPPPPEGVGPKTPSQGQFRPHLVQIRRGSRGWGRKRRDRGILGPTPGVIWMFRPVPYKAILENSPEAVEVAAAIRMYRMTFRMVSSRSSVTMAQVSRSTR